MGQAILRNHQIDGVEKDSVGFWCDAKAERKGMPTSDPALCRAVSSRPASFALDEPGFRWLCRTFFPTSNRYTLWRRPSAITTTRS